MRHPHRRFAEQHSPFTLVPASEHDVTTTQSRRAQPRRWLKTVTWLIGAGIHPKAMATTLSVAQDLAQRMDYQRGIVLYDLTGTARRLDISTATVKRHVKVLRELGALVWLQHGSRRNLRLPGRRYTATATIYGAVIPAVYDQAMGHQLSGHGYTATCTGVTPTGRQHAIAAAQSAGRARREPPSRTSTPHSPTADLRGTSTTTRTARANTTKPKKKSLLGRTITASIYATADQLARTLRPLHNWLQRSRIEELSWVLADKAVDGATVHQVHAWLHEINPAHYFGPEWRPTKPHAYVAARLLQDATHAHEAAQRTACEAQATAPTAEFLDAVHAPVGIEGDDEFAPVATIDDLDGSLLQQLRTEAWRRWLYHHDTELVRTAVNNLGLTEASRLYPRQLIDACISFEANPRLHTAV